jgi:hypothetical protein
LTGSFVTKVLSFGPTDDVLVFSLVFSSSLFTPSCRFVAGTISVVLLLTASGIISGSGCSVLAWGNRVLLVSVIEEEGIGFGSGNFPQDFLQSDTSGGFTGAAAELV